jgi:hypothetical protein
LKNYVLKVAVYRKVNKQEWYIVVLWPAGRKEQRTQYCRTIFATCSTTLNSIQLTKSRVKWARYVAPVGKEINVFWILVGKPEGKTPLGRSKRR